MTPASLSREGNLTVLQLRIPDRRDENMGVGKLGSSFICLQQILQILNSNNGSLCQQGINNLKDTK